MNEFKIRNENYIIQLNNITTSSMLHIKLPGDNLWFSSEIFLVICKFLPSSLSKLFHVLIARIRVYHWTLQFMYSYYREG